MSRENHENSNKSSKFVVGSPNDGDSPILRAAMGDYESVTYVATAQEIGESMLKKGVSSVSEDTGRSGNNPDASPSVNKGPSSKGRHG